MKNIRKTLFVMLMLPILGFSQNFYLGESNLGSGTGNLYSIDAATCTMTTIGAMGTTVTGLATDASGNLFATEATQFANSNLLSINTTTGAATVIGLLDDGVDIHGGVPDITFRGSTLYGWSEINDTVITIDTTTGAVTDLGNGVGSGSTGMAASSTGVLYVNPGDGDLYTSDPVTGITTSLIALVDNTAIGPGNLNALTFDSSGGLWGYSGTTNRVAGELVTVNIATGAIDTVCTGLPLGIDAIAIARGGFAPPAMIPSSTRWFQIALILFFIGLVGLFGYKRFN
jgi:hypothetical protein